MARKPPLQIEVDRRWEFEYKPPEAAFHRRRNRSVGAGIFLLQPGEERELKTPIERDGPRTGQTPKVTVTLAGGRQVSSSETPDVPLRTPVLDGS